MRIGNTNDLRPRREAGPERVGARFLRCSGQQRECRTRAGRRRAEEDRVRADGETAQQHDRGLAEARERARAAAQPRSYYATSPQVPAR
jgi:hypothetical protein